MPAIRTFSLGQFRLGNFTLDADSGELSGAAGIRKLTPKATRVLLALGARTSTVLCKEDLFRQVWAGRVVSDAALTSCIQELRAALGDDARRPRYVETVHRRGYRLRVPLELLHAPTQAAAPPLFGRDVELGLLRAELARACAGDRRIVFVSGEAGIGKSTLLDALLADAGTSLVHATGRCVEHYGPREPYLPLLDAIGALCRDASGDRVLQALRRYAPGWLAQLPGLLDDAELATLARRAVGMTSARMLRELADAVDAIAADSPLVLRLEDLHWADAATLDWLAFAARRREPARLLVLVTLRPPESLTADHPLAAVHAELAPREQCRTLPLGPLDRAAVRDYLAHRLRVSVNHGEMPEIADLIFARTEGNPLFLANVVDSLVERGALAFGADPPSVRVETISTIVPDQLRPLLVRQLERLESRELDLLVVASAIGAQFSADLVASVRGDPIESVEAAYSALARRGAFIAAEEPRASRYRFRHALYRSVLYERLAGATRAALHARIGASLEAMYGRETFEHATELAHHFDSGDRPASAVHFHHLAGRGAARRSAPREAIAHFRRALALLARLEESEASNRREIELCIGLGGQLLASAGWGTAEAEQLYARAQSLCDAGGVNEQSFAALWGLWLYRWGHGELEDAARLGARLESLALAGADSALHLQAHHAQWATALSRGELAACHAHADAGVALYDSRAHSGLAANFGNHDPGACACQFRALAMALRGEAGQARRDCGHAIELAESIGHPFSHALALFFAAAVHQVLREAQAVRDFAGHAIRIADEHGFVLLQAWASTMLGWAEVIEGERARGCERVRLSVEKARATGTGQLQPYLLAVLADSCVHAGRSDEARAATERGLALVLSSRERFYESELLRLEALLASDPGQRASSLARAVEVARAQGAALLLLRAGRALLEIDATRGREVLREVLAGISADDDTDEVRTARALAVRPEGPN